MASSLLAAFWAILGTAVGSFLNLAADRLPAGGSLLSPPSYCATCERRLGLVDLAPILSYLALRGRCRTCRAVIGLRTLVVELATGLLFALTAWKIAPNSPGKWMTLILTSVYLSVLVLATVTDLEHGLILNRMIVPALGLGLVGAILAGWPDLLFHLGGGLAGAGIITLIIILSSGGMGWGDARLAGFIGLATGLPGTLFALFIAFVSGGIVAGAMLLTGKSQRGDTIPLGPFLAFGGGIVLLYGEEALQIFHALATLLR